MDGALWYFGGPQGEFINSLSVGVDGAAFTTLKIEQSSSMDGSPASFQTLWYAQGVGPIKTDIEGVGVSELVSYNFP